MDNKFTKFERLLNNLEHLITEEARAIAGGRVELLESLNKRKNAFIFALCQDDIDCEALDFNEKIASIIENLEYNFKILDNKIAELHKSVEENKQLLHELKKVENGQEVSGEGVSYCSSLLCSA